MIIASNGNTEIAELLLDHQAKPELEDKVHINRIKFPRIANDSYFILRRKDLFL